MKPLTSLLIIVSLPLLCCSFSGKEEIKTPIKITQLSSTQYCNSRFDFCVVYPTSTLPIQDESVNDDGVNLKTIDEQSIVSVNGSYNIMNWSPKGLFKFSVKSITEERGEADIISTVFGEDFYEAFFIYNGNMYFNRSFFVKDYYVSLLIMVPADSPFMMEQLRDEVSVTFGNHG